MVTDFAIPNVACNVYGFYEFLSNETPAYYEMYYPPVNTAISCIVAFLFSPNDGAFTTQILRLLLSLFIINVVKS
jgi:hypothetical protein